MSTLQKIGKRLWKPRTGSSLLMSILVIALTVKSSAFESKSDILRQALRQERLVAIAKCDEPLPGGLKKKEVHVAPVLVGQKDAGFPETMESIFAQATTWIEQNEKDVEIEAIIIPGNVGRVDRNIDSVGGKFNPPGCIILYKKK